MSGQRMAMWSGVLLVCVVAAFLGGYFLKEETAPSRPPRLTFIAGAPDEFYQVVMAGARVAADEFGAEVDYIVPESVNEQSAILSSLNADATDGVAISPRSPRKQTRILSRLATHVPVVTYDNDAPESLRNCYIGTDNYSGGQLSAELVKELLPDGGTIALLIGDIERDNAQLRRLGFIDGLLGRERADELQVDPLNVPLEGNGYKIVGTYLDDHDVDRCRENARKALEANDDLDVLVGLYGYVAPACLQAVEELGKQDKVRIVGFDEHEDTLRGIEEGKIVGTIVQDPYRYGYESIHLLSDWWRDEFSKPTTGNLAPVLIPCRRIGPDDVAEYRETLSKHLALAKKG